MCLYVHSIDSTCYWFLLWNLRERTEQFAASCLLFFFCMHVFLVFYLTPCSLLWLCRVGDRRMNVERQWNVTGRRYPKYSEITCPSNTLCITDVLACGRARAYSVRGWRPTAWAMVRTIFSFIFIRCWSVKFLVDSHVKRNYFRYRRLRRKRSCDRHVHPCGTMSLE